MGTVLRIEIVIISKEICMLTEHKRPAAQYTRFIIIHCLLWMIILSGCDGALAFYIENRSEHPIEMHTMSAQWNLIFHHFDTETNTVKGVPDDGQYYSSIIPLGVERVMCFGIIAFGKHPTEIMKNKLMSYDQEFDFYFTNPKTGERIAEMVGFFENPRVSIERISEWNAFRVVIE